MLVCRKSAKADGDSRRAKLEAQNPATTGRSRIGVGGPVFLPRRKPSAIARNLLAGVDQDERLTDYDEPLSAASSTT